jgi:hypothetical protein
MKKISRSVFLGVLVIVGFNQFVPTAVGQSFLTNGLVAYYPFSGNANDQSTNANNGTPSGAVLAPDRFGQVANAYAFNGAGAYVWAPNKSYLTFPNGGDFTISVWAAFNTLPAGVPDAFRAMAALDNGPGGLPKWIFMYGQLSIPGPMGYSSNYVHFGTTGSSTSGYYLACTPYTPAVGVWHNYLITKAGTSYTLYIDGRATLGATNYLSDSSGLHVGVPGPSSIISGMTAPLTIGWAEGPGSFHNGGLDDIRIYNRALSSNEVAQLYAFEAGPRVELVKAVKPAFYGLTLTTNYQLQVSANMTTWTNHGSPFPATSTSMVYPQYWDVENWNSLFFRLQVVP